MTKWEVPLGRGAGQPTRTPTSPQLLATISVQPEWCLALPLQQQSVLLLAARGPDGIPKTHPCKEVQRAYRACVLVAAKYGRTLRFGEHADTFMSLCRFADSWDQVCDDYLESIDQLPHHFIMHMLHGAEILAYKHPELPFRDNWLMFYRLGCQDQHLPPETEAAMDARLSDWGRAFWEPSS